MINYVVHITVSYIERVRNDVGENKPALVIFNEFKGQVLYSGKFSRSAN